MAGGGPLGQVTSNINSSNPLGPQQGQSAPPTGGAGQMPSFANNPFGPPQQNTGGGFGGQNQTAGTHGGFGGNLGTAGQQPQQPLSIDDYYKTPQLRQSVAFKPGEREAEYQQYRDNFGQQPNNSMVAQSFGDMQYRPQLGQQPFGGQLGQPMQNPFQPQQPSYMQDPEFQGYQTQAQDLSRQMDEYMRKAPMYQQLQDLQGKMAPFQQRENMQRMQQMQQRQQFNPYQQRQQFNPYQQQMQQRQQYQQPAGIRSLMGRLGGRGMQQAPTPMTMDMPQTYGHMEALPQDNALTRAQASEQALRDASAQRFAQMYRMG